MPGYITYLLCINAAGFLICLLNLYLIRHIQRGKLDVLLMVLALAGGAPAVLIPTVLFDHRNVKENIMLKLFAGCILIIQILAFLYWKYMDHSSFSIEIWDLFNRYRILTIYMIMINVVTFALFGTDKRQSQQQGVRVRIATLLACASAGGSVGALLGMYLFRHKIRKHYFSVGVPMILFVQILLLLFVRNCIPIQ